MREIKFRIWNMVGQCMHDWRELVEKNKIHLLADQQSGYPVMQYTGIKDEFGVEIYEGDLVSVWDRSDNERLTSGVVRFGFRGYPGFDIYDRAGDTYSDEYNTFTNDDDLSFKVFGNIHQNPGWTE